MTILFTEEERNWINKTPFNWAVKVGAPQNIKKALEKKLALLYKEDK